jgi:hypothetical protein
MKHDNTSKTKKLTISLIGLGAALLMTGCSSTSSKNGGYETGSHMISIKEIDSRAMAAKKKLDKLQKEFDKTGHRGDGWAELVRDRPIGDPNMHTPLEMARSKFLHFPLGSRSVYEVKKTPKWYATETKDTKDRIYCKSTYVTTGKLAPHAPSSRYFLYDQQKIAIGREQMSKQILKCLAKKSDVRYVDIKNAALDAEKNGYYGFGGDTKFDVIGREEKRILNGTDREIERRIYLHNGIYKAPQHKYTHPGVKYQEKRTSYYLNAFKPIVRVKIKGLVEEYFKRNPEAAKLAKLERKMPKIKEIPTFENDHPEMVEAKRFLNAWAQHRMNEAYRYQNDEQYKKDILEYEKARSDYGHFSGQRAGCLWNIERETAKKGYFAADRSCLKTIKSESELEVMRKHRDELEKKKMKSPTPWNY